nr:M56 family metallopeptidase [Actinomadura sp. RB99]
MVACLIASAVLLGCLAGPALDRLRHPTTNPGTAIVCWVAALAGTLIAEVGIIAVALLSPPAPGHGLLEWLRNCLPHHRAPAITMAAGASLVLLTACGSRLAHSLPRLGRALRHRRRHWEMLKHGRHADVLVLDHPIPVAYSLPARQRAIVVSTGAQETLTPAELAAVLAHERAHLRQHHHALLLMLDLVHALVPWLPTVRRAKSSLPPLLEMAADDAAARTCGHRTLVDALCRLGTAPRVAGALGVAGSTTRGLAERVLRLESAEPPRPRRIVRLVAGTFVASAVAVPLVVVAATIADLSTIC